MRPDLDLDMDLDMGLDLDLGMMWSMMSGDMIYAGVSGRI